MKEGSKTYDRWDLRLLIFSLTGTFLTLSLALALALVSLVALLNRDPASAQSALATSAGVLLLALTGIPAIYLSARTLFSRASPAASRPPRRWLLVIWLFPLGLLLGYLGYERSLLTFVLGPLGQMMAVGAPAAALVVLLRRRGPALRPRRAWGQFLLGLWAVPAVALVVEGILLLATVFVAGIGLSLSPAGQELIAQLQQIAELGDPRQAPALLADIALRPGIVIIVTAFLTLAVPLVEESLKTAAVWPLLPARIRPGEAFLGGALGGAGFALSEAVLLTLPSEGWLLAAGARAGATLMHATGTGLAAWAVAEGAVRKRWARAAGGLLAAYTLHGLWNAGAVAIGLSQLALGVGGEAPDPTLQAISGGGIFLNLALALVAISLLLSFQERFGQQPGEAANGSEVA